MSTFTFNFERKAAPAVESGAMRQAIRAPRNDGRRPVPGDTAKLYTGLRTSAAQLLREAPVVGCRAVRIMFDHPAQLLIDGRLVEPDERSTFAQAEGYASWPDMVAWYRQHRAANGSGSFDGFCVEWQP